jgi:hypothetical protein
MSGRKMRTANLRQPKAPSVGDSLEPFRVLPFVFFRV